MDSVVRCIEMGAEDYLPKPFNATLLKARVESSLARKRLHDREQLVARAMARELEIGRNIQAGFFHRSCRRSPAGSWPPASGRPGRWPVISTTPFRCRMTDASRSSYRTSATRASGAALFMAVFRSLLRVLLRESYAARPDRSDAEHIPHAIRVLSDYNALTHASANMFATVFFGVLEPSAGVLTYVNAGHDAPAVLRDGGLLRRLEPTGPAVGLLPGLVFAVRPAHPGPGRYAARLHRRRRRRAEPRRRFLREERLFRAAAQALAPTQSVPSLLDSIDAELLAHTAGAEPFDDITLLALRRS